MGVGLLVFFYFFGRAIGVSLGLVCFFVFREIFWILKIEKFEILKFGKFLKKSFFLLYILLL